MGYGLDLHPLYYQHSTARYPICLNLKNTKVFGLFLTTARSNALQLFGLPINWLVGLHRN